MFQKEIAVVYYFTLVNKYLNTICTTNFTCMLLLILREILTNNINKKAQLKIIFSVHRFFKLI